MYITQLAAATSYEERSAIRKAIRQLKKERGEQIGRVQKKGVAGYNRFAATTAPRSTQAPKSYIAGTPGAEELSKPQPVSLQL